MAKRSRDWSKAKIEKRVKDGRGQGFGKEYTPWLTIHDVPSNGVVTRTKSWTVGRIHHVMSNFERSYLYMVDWSDQITDIREQYPLLPLERTIEIAAELGVQHPKDPRTKEEIVITTDFMLSTVTGSQYARTLKYASDLSIRTVEKLTIEQRFYQEQGIDWKVVTNSEIPQAFVKNIEWLHRARFLEFAPAELNERLIGILAPQLLQEIQKQSRPLSTITIEFDSKAGLPVGSSMFVIQHMLATKKWEVDMYRRIIPSEVISLTVTQQPLRTELIGQNQVG